MSKDSLKSESPGWVSRFLLQEVTGKPSPRAWRPDPDKAPWRYGPAVSAVRYFRYVKYGAFGQAISAEGSIIDHGIIDHGMPGPERRSTRRGPPGRRTGPLPDGTAAGRGCA
ncbi:hypothetical protein GCM10023191_068720 [Actinoallomurus oryzae]|uniref:Uncharacterized protein n=1 Tax=Actinoallomurus oryzae TaxID=502180 RepID=A0ABP8QTH7_9ACTN